MRHLRWLVAVGALTSMVSTLCPARAQDAGTFTSRLRLFVSSAPPDWRGADEDAGELLGTTPGTVTLPAGQAITIEPSGVAVDADVAVFVADAATLTAPLRLGMQFSDVTDASLDALVPLHNLVGLDLTDTAVSDAGMEVVAELTSLAELWVPEGVTDQGVQALAPLKGLRAEWPALKASRLGGGPCRNV